MKEKFDQKYCEKHNQYYADYLDKCPVCLGERMIQRIPDPPIKKRKRKNLKYSS